MTPMSQEPFWVVVVSTLHALAWSVYVGGAVCMELVLRHAQQFMKPSQIAVVCQKSGKSYRWWSFVCLLVLFATGVALARHSGLALNRLDLASIALWGLVTLWFAQLFILGLLSFRIHPDMHARLASDMTEEQIKIERARVGRAIVSMDRTVRIELGCALVAMLLGSLIQFSPLLSGG